MVYLLLYIDQFFYVLPPVLLLVIGGSVVFAKKNEENMEKQAITGQHNYHRASIHLTMYGLYDL